MNYLFKNKSLEELFQLITEEDALKIVRFVHNKLEEETKHWKVKKHFECFKICVSDVEELHPNTSTIIVLTDNFDLYTQGTNLKQTKYRVGNLFPTYEFISKMLSQKLELIEA